MSGGGQQKATHALLLASVSALLSSMLLEVYDTEEDMILLLPDFSMEEVKTCLQAIMSSEGQIGLAKSLGISSSKDVGKSLKRRPNNQNNTFMKNIPKPTTNIERPE